jgi:hypothetical protein
MGLAPDPQFPERGTNSYDRKVAPSIPGNRGPLRFEEGLATDTDVPDDFVRGMQEGMIAAPGRFNHVNPDVQYKHADEVMRERAHVGSAAWVDSPSMLGDFADGSFTEKAEVTFQSVIRSGGKQNRGAPNRVTQ